MTRLLEEKPRVAERAGAVPDSATATSQKGKVLLVEDNPLNQKVLGMFISKLGFEYDIAYNGLTAVSLSK
ncbi:MAG TPA: hypothetical protein PLB87_07750, partial [Prolixibacteraceae bacterium]|nr:hypothetical protein [Prolixibacteraceae bacterium]